MNNRKTIADPIEVSGIHFLIHPGFRVLPDEQLRSSPRKFQKQARKNEQRFGNLLVQYAQKARTLRVDEIMFIFSHVGYTDFQNDVAAGLMYTKTICAIRKLLGTRAITIHDQFFQMFEDSDQEADLGKSPVIIEAKRIAELNGFSISPNVPSEAYGEMLETCVCDGAESLNIAFHLTTETLIRTRLTDLIHATEEEIRATVTTIRSRDEHDSVIFDCEKSS
ncbi:MAG: hypothetical protein WCG83_05510 [Candidatus Peregrinibacteria bacterium]